MSEATYESTDTIHIRISDFDGKPDTPASKLRDTIHGEQLQEEDIYDPMFLQLLESVYDAVLICQLHGRIVKNNSRAVAFFKHDEEELCTHNVLDLIAGATFEHLQTIYTTLKEERRVFIEAECTRRDGTTFPADITVNLIVLDGVEHMSYFVRNITSRKQTQAALQKAQEELVRTAHHAGMAQIATGVLHDVGNLLNSVNISCEMIRNAARPEALEALELICSLFEDHQNNLVEFLTEDETGQSIPEFLQQIHAALVEDTGTLEREAGNLKTKIATINDVITTQQEYARGGLFMEEVSLPQVIEDALALQQASLARQQLVIEKLYSDVPPIRVQKSKLIHALVNVIKNARDALADVPEEQRQLIIETGVEDDRVYCCITDNGQGIVSEDLERIFTHGFSTKPEGHGFGLHTSANFIAEMGGTMAATSDGPGCGATFSLYFPLNADEAEGGETAEYEGDDQDENDYELPDEGEIDDEG